MQVQMWDGLPCRCPAVDAEVEAIGPVPSLDQLAYWLYGTKQGSAFLLCCIKPAWYVPMRNDQDVSRRHWETIQQGQDHGQAQDHSRRVRLAEWAVSRGQVGACLDA